jgi:hypothetical protein
VRLIAPVLTAENHVELIAAMRHRSKREIEALLAVRFPKQDVRDAMRKLPGPMAAEAAASPTPGTRSNTRHIPNEVRRQVLARDGRRCTFVSELGRRCEERGGSSSTTRSLTRAVARRRSPTSAWCARRTMRGLPSGTMDVDSCSGAWQTRPGGAT